jgi:hypothetical protein
MSGERRITDCRYSEKDRAAIKQHIERVFARRGGDCGVDFAELWRSLEIAAMAYEQKATPDKPPSASKTIKELIAWRAAIDDLVRNCLQNETLFEFDFVLASGSRIMKGTSRKSLPALIEELNSIRDEFAESIAELKGFVGGSERAHAADADESRATLQGLVLELGQKLFGRQIGNPNGPLVKFVRLVLRPILGAETPSPVALRKFAQREGGGQQE